MRERAALKTTDTPAHKCNCAYQIGNDSMRNSGSARLSQFDGVGTLGKTRWHGAVVTQAEATAVCVRCQCLPARHRVLLALQQLDDDGLECRLSYAIERRLHVDARRHQRRRSTRAPLAHKRHQSHINLVPMKHRRAQRIRSTLLFITV